MVANAKQPNEIHTYPRNAAIAEKLEEAATVLEQQGSNPFRANAYRRAGRSIRALRQDIGAIAADEGRAGLMAVPGVGPGIAAAIDEILRTGQWSRLARLRGEVEPERLFRTIPGVGPELARRIHDALNVDTLEALEQAAHDGRLEKVAGIGTRRAAAPRAELAQIFSRVHGRHPRSEEEPPVAVLLDIDQRYREAAEAGKLAMIAPRRFNPSGAAWLPILHAERGPWRFTALYSNTARAHELGRTRDWVVVYFHKDDEVEGQRTVVTETHGPLVGRRVVRGREGE